MTVKEGLAHGVQIRPERGAKDAVTIMEEITRDAVPRKRVPELLASPFRRRMGGHIDVDDAPAIMGQYQENVQDLEPDGRHGEEIHRDQVVDVVRQERAPRLRGGIPAPQPVTATSTTGGLLASAWAAFATRVAAHHW